jgi:hypothetical protein
VRFALYQYSSIDRRAFLVENDGGKVNDRFFGAEVPEAPLAKKEQRPHRYHLEVQAKKTAMP